jgi:hypothetical protein
MTIHRGSITNTVSTRYIVLGILYGTPPGILSLYFFGVSHPITTWHGIFYAFAFLIFSVLLPIRLVPIVESLLAKYSNLFGGRLNELEKHVGPAIAISCISTYMLAATNHLFLGLVIEEQRNSVIILLSLIVSTQNLLLAIAWGGLSGVLTLLISNRNLSFVDWKKAKNHVITFTLVGWVVPIVLLTCVMTYLYFFPRDVAFAFQPAKDLWLELTQIILFASIITMLPFPLVMDLIKYRTNTDEPTESVPRKDQVRNLFVSLCVIITGIFIMKIFIESAMGPISGVYAISQPDVVGECAFCSFFGVLAIYIATYGAVIVFVTISPFRTNWSPPHDVGTRELIRRTSGFIFFLIGIQPQWSWVFAICGFIVLLAPNTYQKYISNLIRNGPAT